MTQVQLLNLTQLKPHQKGVIKEFGETELYIKLMEMGCVPGEDIIVEITAPLGDPIAIMVAGYNLSIRKEVAEQIKVVVQ